ncbi:hypothetical protein H8D04_00185 [bacterium]|nr:hypothetical protein [bacterium]
MSRNNLIRKIVRELIKQELDEANSTASVGGSYNTPHAFGGSNKSGKKKGKAGYTKGHDDPTKGTGQVVARDPKLRKEGKYHDYRNDDTMTPKQKIGQSMREVRDKLNELDKLVKMNVKLKTELSVDSRSYWKRTHGALNKISERLVKLSKKIGQLY